MATYRPPHLRGHSTVVHSNRKAGSETREAEDVRIADVAIAESCRVYIGMSHSFGNVIQTKWLLDIDYTPIGNMPYFAKEDDIRAFFQGFLV